LKQTQTSKPNSSRTKPLSEAHIQATCTAWLELDGWRCVRTDMPHLRGLGVSEPGMADHQFIRYANENPYQRVPGGYRGDRQDYKPRQWAEVLWVEFKKRGGNAEQHQKDWHAKERARGGLVWVLGEDFEASIESFCEFYSKSGLQRKRISIPR
jgi:hypothetical protein